MLADDSILSNTVGENTFEPAQKSAAMNYIRGLTLALGGYYFGYYIAITNPMVKPLILLYDLHDDPVTHDDAATQFKGNINAFFSLEPCSQSSWSAR